MEILETERPAKMLQWALDRIEKLTNLVQNQLYPQVRILTKRLDEQAALIESIQKPEFRPAKPTKPARERKPSFRYKDVKDFVFQCCYRAENQTVTKVVLFDAYLNWCVDHNRVPLKENVFARDLRRAAPGIIGTQPRDGVKRVMTYIGIALKADGQVVEASA